MELKTNTNLESFGADGVHLRWNDADDVLDIFCAESKLEDTPSDAIAHCAKSIEKFHATEAYRHELKLATAHCKQVDPEFRAILGRIMAGQELGVNYRLRHACLAGYDWKGYANLTGTQLPALEQALKQRYLAHKPALLNLLQTHFGAIKRPLIAFEVFLLPFRTVQEFRTAFLNAV
jgi:hypothetical protein